MKKPPYPLAAGCALYLLLELWILAIGIEPRPKVAIRTVITLSLFYFVLRGSRAAGIIWGICNLLGGLIALYAAVAFASSNPSSAVFFAIAAILAISNACYLFFNSTVRSFQTKPTTAAQ